MDIQRYVDALKAGQGSIVRQTKDVAGPIQVVGDPDRMKLLFKAAGPTWVRSTKAMESGDGCVVQVSTKVMTSAGDWNVAEATTYVPGVRLAEEAGGGRYLAAKE
jgi:outer membrane receptor for Fe3+-dicitrate